MVTRWICNKLEKSFDNLGNGKMACVKAFAIGVAEGFIDMALITGVVVTTVGYAKLMTKK